LTYSRSPNLSPLSKQGHQGSTEKHTDDHESQAVLAPGEIGIEQEIPSQQLDERGVDENPGRDGIQHAADHVGSEAARLVRVTQSQADGDGNRGGEAVAGAEKPGQPGHAAGEWDGGHPGADTQSLEGLVEDDDRVEGVELGAGSAQVQADDDGVEDDAEFEDQEGRDLLAEGALFDLHGRRRDAVLLRIGLEVLRCREILQRLRRGNGGVEVLVLVAAVQLVVGERAARVSPVGVAMGMGMSRALGLARMVSDDSVDGRAVTEAILPVDVLLRAKVHEEDQSDGGENNGRTPRVVSPVTGHAHA
jgi:hypothetical protein